MVLLCRLLIFNFPFCRVGTVPTVVEEEFAFRETPEPDILGLNTTTGMVSLNQGQTIVDMNFTVLITRTDNNTCKSSLRDIAGFPPS